MFENFLALGSFSHINFSKKSIITLDLKYLLPPIHMPTWDYCLPKSSPYLCSCCRWVCWFFCANLGRILLGLKILAIFAQRWLANYNPYILSCHNFSTTCPLEIFLGWAAILQQVLHTLQIRNPARLPFNLKTPLHFHFCLELLETTPSRIFARTKRLII